MYKGTPIRLLADFSAEALQARREWHDILKVLTKKETDQEYSIWQNYHSDLMER